MYRPGIAACCRGKSSAVPLSPDSSGLALPLGLRREMNAATGNHAARPKRAGRFWREDAWT